VNPKGAATTVCVQYGPTDSYGSETPCQTLAAGNADQTLSFDLTGLSPGTTYHYQAFASHSDGSTGYGAQMLFTTDKLPVAVLKADKASGSYPLTVTFDGSASSDPDGSISSWKLDFGDGSAPKTGTGSPGSISHTYLSKCTCTASLTVTDNQEATSKPAKVVIHVSDAVPLLSAVSPKVGPTSARVSVHVDPKGTATKVWVEYGTTGSHGKTSVPKTVPAGAAKTVTLTLTGLSQQTTYHYSVVASHTDGGQATSADATFKTPKLKPIHVGLKTGTVTATGGAAPLPFTCKGNAVFLCHIQVLLELGNKSVGSKSFPLLPGHSKTVRVKLSKSALRKLAHGPLHLTLTVSWGGASFQTMHVTVLP
jgi:PKD repeat protein